MANTLNAGEKMHLKNYSVRYVDGKFKVRESKNPYIAINALCGIRHRGQDIHFWSELKKEYPESVCKKCEKKLKRLIDEAH